jgi:hypothetical protein
LAVGGLLVFFSVSELLEPKKADAKEEALFFFVEAFFSSLRRGVEEPDGIWRPPKAPERAPLAKIALRRFANCGVALQER